MDQSPLQLEYADSSKSSILMKALLAGGLQFDYKAPRFHATKELESTNNNKYRCYLEIWFFKETEASLNAKLANTSTLRFISNADALAKLLKAASPNMSDAEPAHIPTSLRDSIVLKSGVLNIEVPISLASFNEMTDSGNPKSRYEERVSLGSIDCQLSISIIKMGSNAMSVKDRHEEFESPSVVSGGLPFTNRRRS